MDRFTSPELVTVWGKDDLALDEAKIGLAGSPTIVSGLSQAPEQERRRERLTGTDEEIVAQLVAIVEPYLR